MHEADSAGHVGETSANEPTAKPGVSLYEFAGGAPAFARLAEAHYRRCLSDPLLTPLFGAVARSGHAAALADWLAEVFGGPKSYTRSTAATRRW